MKVLEIKNLGKNFGGFKVLKDVTLSVEQGERRAVIGPNGAGKTTLFNIISGILKADEGDIFFLGQKINALPPFKRSRLGIARTFQQNNLFFNLTVADNLKIALDRVISSRKPIELLEKVGLESRSRTRIRELSYGEQRQVEILLALAQSPKLIFLDEPTAGMSPVETKAIIKMIQSLPREITVLMVEHDMEVVFSLADRITVLHLGEILCEGDDSQVRSDARVKKVYLGKTDEGVEDNA